MSAVASVSVGTGYRKFLFAVGVLGMLHVEVKANSIEEAQSYIMSRDCVQDFPVQLRDEILGEEFKLLKEV
jgi:hypothetical protein